VKKRLSTESTILEQLVNQKQSELDAMPDHIDTMISDRYDISIERFKSVDRISCGCCPLCKYTTIYYELDIYAPKHIEPSSATKSVSSISFTAEQVLSGNQFSDFRQLHKTWKQFVIFHERLQKEMKQNYKKRGRRSTSFVSSFKDDAKEGYKPFPGKVLPSSHASLNPF
jgi:hypothetical protein